LFGLCLVFVTLVVCHTSLIIWPTCHRVNFLANSCQSLASNFLATLFMAAILLWLATLWLGKMWLGTKHPLTTHGSSGWTMIKLSKFSSAWSGSAHPVITIFLHVIFLITVTQNLHHVACTNNCYWFLINYEMPLTFSMLPFHMFKWGW
jgi:hypothetical protein